MIKLFRYFSSVTDIFGANWVQYIFFGWVGSVWGKLKNIDFFGVKSMFMEYIEYPRVFLGMYWVFIPIRAYSTLREGANVCEQKLFCSHNFFFIPPPTPTFRQKLYSQHYYAVREVAKEARGGLRIDLKLNVQTRRPRNNPWEPPHGEMQLKKWCNWKRDSSSCNWKCFKMQLKIFHDAIEENWKTV